MLSLLCVKKPGITMDLLPISTLEAQEGVFICSRFLIVEVKLAVLVSVSHRIVKEECWRFLVILKS